MQPCYVWQVFLYLLFSLFISEPQHVLMFGHVPHRAERWKMSPEVTKYFKKRNIMTVNF